MSDEFKSFVLGLFCGAALMNFIWIFYDTRESSPVRQAKEAIAACEAELPRNQFCVITAKPKELK